MSSAIFMIFNQSHLLIPSLSCSLTFSTSCRYEPEDQLEWSLVLEEIKGFVKAEAAVAVLHADSNPIVLSYR